jgi:hypothetical protein
VFNNFDAINKEFRGPGTIRPPGDLCAGKGVLSTVGLMGNPAQCGLFPDTTGLSRLDEPDVSVFDLRSIHSAAGK